MISSIKLLVDEGGRGWNVRIFVKQDPYCRSLVGSRREGDPGDALQDFTPRRDADYAW